MLTRERYALPLLLKSGDQLAQGPSLACQHRAWHFVLKLLCVHTPKPRLYVGMGRRAEEGVGSVQKPHDGES